VNSKIKQVSDKVNKQHLHHQTEGIDTLQMTENIAAAGGGANRNPIPAHRTFQHRSLFQNLYKDKIDLSNIPNDLKNMIMDQSTARLAIYEPAKFVTRSVDRH
jgi:hypothetical protein